MSASGFTPIQLFRTSTASAIPSAGTLADGELAINLTDERLYFKNAAGVVKLLASNAGSLGTVTSVAASGGTTGLTFSGSPITTSGTLTLGGTLAVANGGTGVTSSTGSVSVVLSKSPTLETPILGAATATSIANGLGAVGTPSYTFVGDLNTGVWSPAADTVAFSTNGAERMRIADTGNVGIGTTSPGAKLQINIQDGFRFDVEAGAASTMRFGSALTGESTGALAWVRSAGAMTFSSGATGSALTERMRIDPSGNLGIGTASPAARLDLNGNTAQNIVAVAASDVNCALGNFFTKTATGALTWTFSSPPASRVYSFLLELTNGGTGAQTWPASVDWPGGTAPTLTAAGVDMLGFITDDGGAIWRGVVIMLDSK